MTPILGTIFSLELSSLTMASSSPMVETTQIRAVEMVRHIRDGLARELVGKSREEIIAFYRKAGEAARAATKQESSGDRLEPTRR